MNDGAELFRKRQVSLPVGAVLRRRPGATRWARWIWSAVAVLPGAGPADGAVLHHDGDRLDVHAATIPLVLHRAEVEAYRVSLAMTPPAVFVITEDTDGEQCPQVVDITASAFLAQDCAESGDQQVDAVPMPEGLVAFVERFVEAHFREEKFKKRKQNREDIDRRDDGVGDARVRQMADVYRAPGEMKSRTGR